MKKGLKYILPVLNVFYATSVFAQDAPPQITGNGGQLAKLVDNLIGYLFPVAGIIALVFIIIAGYMWIISAGDPARVKQAQGTITWAIIGLVFVMIILGILKVVLDYVYQI